MKKIFSLPELQFLHDRTLSPISLYLTSAVASASAGDVHLLR